MTYTQFSLLLIKVDLH
nr:leu operon leader peptide - Lactococcus lactis subsp. lactis (strain IL1403) [Lactococcus lactis subsp. lactis]